MIRRQKISFNIDDPPNTFKQFRKDVLKAVELADVEIDEQYPISLFFVDREGGADIIEIDELVDKYDIDPDVPLTFIMHVLYPSVVKKNAGKYFGIVFPGTQLDPADGSEVEIILALTGSMDAIDMVAAEIERDENFGYCTLEPWEKVNIEGFDELVVPFRRSVTLQG